MNNPTVGKDFGIDHDAFLANRTVRHRPARIVGRYESPVKRLKWSAITTLDSTLRAKRSTSLALPLLELA